MNDGDHGAYVGNLIEFDLFSSTRWSSIGKIYRYTTLNSFVFEIVCAMAEKSNGRSAYMDVLDCLCVCVCVCVCEREHISVYFSSKLYCCLCVRVRVYICM